MTLIYNGNGEGIVGIPARDLTDTEINALASNLGVTPDELIALITSRGLYSLPAQPKKPKTTAVAVEPAPLETEE